MDGDWWPQASMTNASANLADVRHAAAAFLDNLLVAAPGDRDRWIHNWMTVGDRYRDSAEFAIRKKLQTSSSESWFCALTAFEVARELADPGSSSSIALEDRMEASLRSFEACEPRRVERVEIEPFDQVRLAGCFLPPACRARPAPVVICISDEESSVDTSLSRLLPAAEGRNLSILVVRGDDASRHRLFGPEAFLASWVNYLESRSDVDADRIAVSGERMAASHASRIAATDRRIVAAVCDGGLWTAVRHRANVGWMTGIWDPATDRARTSSLQLVQRMRCPVLIVAGGRAMVDQQDALELQADCKLAGVDCSIAISRGSGELENFVTKDDFVLDWLERKLGPHRQFEPINYL
ncbi:S9 family peptidase [Bradyrhizobium sp. CCGUVB23]|uniref:alpha/beta hydrolase family protein n=1 Tax=Bradyrhizobium sp. CCGUVB23 TaxID=2949630 RepID=UPI0020B201FE|nr:alpha/beta hydrolase [Bradyrhizobium sp. CCGUVB23]MCP3465693.1 alpha/beta hydrolase [Bradyrhizobium sp. CCGUVB23]